MPARIHSREEIIHRLTQTFREHGYEGASLSRISKLTGLGKASLYHHFPGGKEDMGFAVLDGVAAWFDQHVRRPLAESGTPEDRLRRMTLALEDFYAGGRTPCLLELFAVGEARSSFGSTLAATAHEWQSAMSRVVEQAGFDKLIADRRALDALIQIQGSLVVSRATGNPSVFMQTMAVLPTRMLEPES